MVGVQDAGSSEDSQTIRVMLCFFHSFAEMDGRVEIGDSQLQGQ